MRAESQIGFRPLFIFIMSRRSALILALALPLGALAAEPAIVPNPASIVRHAGEFRFAASTAFVVEPGDGAARRVAENLADLIRATHDVRLPVREGRVGRGAIVLRHVKDDGAKPESYRIESRREGVVLTAASDAGLVHAGATLWQLLTRDKNGIAVPALDIDDAPRFGWRGLMLDSARHFQSPKFITQLIDWMALHKLNVLHWHLTDDQAWRLEIRKYPKLAQVGGWRVPAGAAAAADIDSATGKPRLYGGYYSQETVRSIVAYAADRGITIVPEIEMPGHASAAVAAYPQLAAGAHPPTVVPADWGIYDNVYNLEDSTFAFIEDVLTEVMAIFPGSYIHVGGDEVETTQWRDSARVKVRMRELGIADVARVQPYFTQRVGRFLVFARPAPGGLGRDPRAGAVTQCRGDVVARDRGRAQGGGQRARHGARGLSHALLRQSPERLGRRAAGPRARGVAAGRVRLRADAQGDFRREHAATCWACRPTCGPSTSAPRSGWRG